MRLIFKPSAASELAVMKKIYTNMPKGKYIIVSFFLGFALAGVFADILFPFWRMHPEYKIFAAPITFISWPLFSVLIYYTLKQSYKQKKKEIITKSVQLTAEPPGDLE